MTKFENKLKQLFDAQDFFCDPELGAVIQRETAKPLSDDELASLYAAGDPFAAEENGDGRSDDKK